MAVPASLESHGTASGSADDHFFQHHGVWAPGVRLFRQLNFRGKALIVSACFLLPIALLGFGWFKGISESIAFSAKERDGVAFVREVAPLQLLLMQQRTLLLAQPPGAPATAALATLRQEISARLKRIEAAQVASGNTMGTAKALEALKPALAAAEHPATAVWATFEAQNKAVEAAIALLSQVTDGSNLTLDPDIDTYYLMDGALMRLPHLLDHTGRLHDLGTALAHGLPRDGMIDDAMTRGEMYGDLLEGDLEGAIAKVEGEHPGTRAALRYDEARTAVHAVHDATATDPDAARLGLVGAAADQALAALQTRLLDRLDELLADRVSGMAFRRQAMGATVLLSLVAAGYLFWSFYLVVQGGLAEVRRHLAAMTYGDLTTHPHPWGSDEAAQLMVSLSEMQESLRRIVSEVRQGSDEILHASTEIAEGALDLSARTEQTAASLEQTAASMEQIGGTVRSTADNAGQAAQIALENSQVASDGGRVMTEVVQTMAGIGESSARINEIIGTIDGIAFQTNILALNAAVEAARAGDAGRGFAVVASEVRALAQRSGAAAREIKSLIQASVDQVQGGTETVSRARVSIDQVVSNAQRIGDLIGEIATGAREQTLGMAQIGQAAQELDRSTQGNAALVEQTAAASQALRDQAQQLSQRVSRFRLPDGAVAAVAADVAGADASNRTVAAIVQAQRGL